MATKCVNHPERNIEARGLCKYCTRKKRYREDPVFRLKIQKGHAARRRWRWHNDPIYQAKIQAQNKRYRPERLGIPRAAWTKTYGLAPEQYRAFRATRTTCEICEKQCSLQIDHDHATNKIRGLLCNGCNTGLGGFRDNPVYMLRAIEYLTKQLPFRAPFSFLEIT